MNEAKYTPGPWVIHANEGVALITDGSKATIADVWTHDVGVDQATDNALLIAAAPELLEFAHLVADLVGIPPYMTPQAQQLMRLQDKARAVIAKAKGQSHAD